MSNHEKLLKSNERDGYREYLAKLGAYAPATTDVQAQIATKKAVKSADYGVSGEELAAAGLQGSGYESYLNTLVERESEKKLADAERVKQINQYKHISGYRRYVDNYNSAQEKIQEGVIERIKELACFDSDYAYRLAIESGLSEDNARSVSKYGVVLAKKKAILEAISYSKRHNLYSYNARKYALNLGLDSKSADIVAAAMLKANYGDITDYTTLTPEAYLNILKQRAEENND